MTMTKLAAAALAGALALSTTAVASAQSSNNASPAAGGAPANIKFVDGKDGSSFTGSSLLDLTVVSAGILAGLKVVADNVPALRQPIVDAMNQLGLWSSSEGLDLNISRLLPAQAQ